MKSLIVDGEDLSRLSLKEVVRLAGGFAEVITATSEHEFLSKTANHEEFSLIVLHPETLEDSGENCLKLARRLYPDAAVILIRDTKDAPRVLPETGITVSRSMRITQLITIIRQAMNLPSDSRITVDAASLRPDLSNITNSNAEQLQAHSQPLTDLSNLSFRQKQILAMAADGLSNKDIADRLDIAEGTVKAHMHAIFKVLGVKNRTQAVLRYNGAGQTNTPFSQHQNGALTETAYTNL